MDEGAGPVAGRSLRSAAPPQCDAVRLRAGCRRAGEDANKTLEYELKPALCLPWLELRDRRLFADDELQFGDQAVMSRAFGSSASRNASRKAPSSGGALGK